MVHIGHPIYKEFELRGAFAVSAGLAVGLLILFGIWWEDRPVTQERLQEFTAETPCHRKNVAYKLWVSLPNAPLVRRDLWVIAKECRKEAQRQEEASIKAGQLGALRDPG